MTGRKKTEEFRHFALFKKCCKDFPQGNPEHGDKPDFLIKHSTGVLGIEHTQLFKTTKHPSKEHAPQAIEAFRQEIVDSAKKQCQEDIPPLFVEVWFNFNQVVPKNRTSEIKRISHSLAEFVRKWHYKNPSKFYETLKPLDEISEILQMIIARSGLPYHLWKVVEPAWVHNLTSEILQNCIDEKNPLYKEYRKKCDECWLLIVGHLFKNSQSFEMRDKITHKFKSDFERIYYLDASHREDLWEFPVDKT